MLITCSFYKIMKKLKKLVISLALLPITLITGCNNAKATINTNDGKEADTAWESAKDCAQNMKVGWNLGNTLDCTDHTNAKYDTEVSWGNPRTTKAMIDAVKAKGFETVRLPITWRNHLDNSGNVDSDWLDRVQTVVDYVVDNNMYAIINMHHDTGDGGWITAEESNYERNKNVFAKIWSQIGTRFEAYDNHLLFEGLNELLSESKEWVNPNMGSLNAVNLYNQLFVDTIRGLGGNNAKRNLIVSTYAASSSNTSIGGFILPSDNYSNHLMVELHTYNPWNFCSSYTASWSSSLKNSITGDFARMRGAFGDLPVIIGEFGCVHRKNIQDQIDYVRDTCEVLKANKFVPIVWDDGGSFGILNRKTLSWDQFKPGYAEAIVEVYSK